jgi:hypothetical protein
MKRRATVRASVLALGFIGGLLSASEAGAQAAGTNKAFVRDLFFLEAFGPESVSEVNQINGAFADAIARFMGLALTTTPTPSSSAGFSFITSSTGLQKPKSNSFGPAFADRPFTNGKGVLSLGLNFQYAQTNFNGAFDTADGRDEGLPILDNPRVYQDDFVEYNTIRAFLGAKSRSFNFLLSYGVTEQFDIGVVVPVVSLSLTGRTDLAYDETKQTQAGQNPPGFAPTGVIPITLTATNSATGVGDVVVRAKYSWTGDRSEGTAVTADLRLPTGDEDELLGAGKAAIKVQGVVLKSLGVSALHANGGFTAGGISTEINYAVGVDAPMLARQQLTASASLLGRTLLSGALPVRRTTIPATTDPGGGSLGSSVFQIDRFEWTEETLTLLQAAAGIKLQVSRGWLVTASALIPLNRRGLQPRVSPVFGLERTW